MLWTAKDFTSSAMTFDCQTMSTALTVPRPQRNSVWTPSSPTTTQSSYLRCPKATLVGWLTTDQGLSWLDCIIYIGDRATAGIKSCFEKLKEFFSDKGLVSRGVLWVACIRGNLGSIRVLETWTLIIALLGVENWTSCTSKSGPARSLQSTYLVDSACAFHRAIHDVRASRFNSVRW
jgi:hypothetical protein